MANFSSDNTAPVHPKVLDALSRTNDGHAPAYGNDPVTEKLNAAMRITFRQPELRAFPVFNGSACNGLALARMIRPYKSILAHRQSHINNDECGLPEFFTGGKIIPFEGVGAKLTVEALGNIVEKTLDHAPHTSRVKAISLTQSTELGTTYKIDELKALSAFARSRGIYVHMDGARLANAVTSLGCHVAEITTEIGIDILSFGGTKNGAMLAEAAVILNPALIEDFAYIHKRSGQLPSKARYVSAQLLALLEDDLWLDLGRQSNAMAAALREGLTGMAEVDILYPVEANELFVTLPKALADKLLARHSFYHWPNEGEHTYRLVTSWSTTPADVIAFLADCRG